MPVRNAATELLTLERRFPRAAESFIAQSADVTPDTLSPHILNVAIDLTINISRNPSIRKSFITSIPILHESAIGRGAHLATRTACLLSSRADLNLAFRP